MRLCVVVCSSLWLQALCLSAVIWVSFGEALLTTLGADASLGVSPSSMYNLRGLWLGLLGDGCPALRAQLALRSSLASSVLTLWLWSGVRGALELRSQDVRDAADGGVL